MSSLRDVRVHRGFSYESPDERILKIGPHLPKLLSHIEGLTFLEYDVYRYSLKKYANDIVQINFVNIRCLQFTQFCNTMALSSQNCRYADAGMTVLRRMFQYQCWESVAVIQYLYRDRPSDHGGQSQN